LISPLAGKRYVEDVRKQDAKENVLPQRQEFGGWRKLQIEELHNLFSPNIIRAIKSGRMGWLGYIVRIRG
jgi:hypothetical protein